MRRISSESGFSLIGVLAALLVFSIGILGLMRAGTQSTQSVGVLQDKMLAGIIADNQLTLARSQPVIMGVQNGRARPLSVASLSALAPRAPSISVFFTFDVSVRRETSGENGQLIVKRTAFLAKAAP